VSGAGGSGVESSAEAGAAADVGAILQMKDGLALVAQLVVSSFLFDLSIAQNGAM
jgi:hypothetical protein